MKHLRTFAFKTLHSRKFWAAVAASIPLAFAADWQAFALVWVAYAGIQGGVDAMGARVATTPQGPSPWGAPSSLEDATSPEIFT